MADEAEFLTVNAANNSWVDASPNAESTGYGAQNTNIDGRTVGQDDTHIAVSGTNIILDPSGVIDDNGIPIVIKSQITLSTVTDTTHYIAVVAGSSTTQRSLSIVTTAGLWDVSKNAYYEAGVRILNWEIRNASGVVKYYKRMKPESGLIVPHSLIVDNDGSIGNDLTVGNDLAIGNDLTAIGAIKGASIDTGNGAVELDQDLLTTSNIVVSSIDTGNGATEIYAMDQPVRTTDALTFGALTVDGAINPTTTPPLSSFSLTTTPQLIPRGIYSIEHISSQTDYSFVEMQKTSGVWVTISSGNISTFGSATKGDIIFSDGSNFRVSIKLSTGTMSYRKF